MWLKFHKRIGFGRAGLCFWDELPGRFPLLGTGVLERRKGKGAAFLKGIFNTSVQLISINIVF